MCDIPGGTGLTGTGAPQIANDAEGPLRRKPIEPFQMAETAITNAQFAAFVTATGYKTDAERLGWSFVFWAQISEEITMTEGVMGHDWWRRVEGANWRDIGGPETADVACRSDNPVVHVSWNDATAYAKWVGGRLPSEAQWEHAARGGLGDVKFPWGDAEPDDERFQPCNIWQGQFPHQNLRLDGYADTAPARSFDPNGYGLFNMVGNVWEWTREPFVLRASVRLARTRRHEIRGMKLVKGGSFLCHRSYCYRYRIAARVGNTPNTSLSHTGFRVCWP